MREELAKLAWSILIKGHPPHEAARLAYAHADAFVAAGKGAGPMPTDDIANEINTGIANCVNWGNLEAYWTSPQTQADLNRLKKEAPETLEKLVKVMKQRKEQIADNHQVEHAKGQAA